MVLRCGTPRASSSMAPGCFCNVGGRERCRCSYRGSDLTRPSAPGCAGRLSSASWVTPMRRPAGSRRRVGR
jgi:hypothetical protein